MALQHNNLDGNVAQGVSEFWLPHLGNQTPEALFQSENSPSFCPTNLLGGKTSTKSLLQSEPKLFPPVMLVGSVQAQQLCQGRGWQLPVWGKLFWLGQCQPPKCIYQGLASPSMGTQLCCQAARPAQKITSPSSALTDLVLWAIQSDAKD